MSTVPISEAKKELARFTSLAQYRGDRTILTKHGKPVAAIVPCEDLAALEAMEHRIDQEAAKAARKEPGAVPYSDVRATLGL